MFSTIGLCASDSSKGIDSFYLHYNRYTRSIWTRFIDSGLRYAPELSSPMLMTFGGEKNYMKLSFYSANSFIILCSGIETISMLNEAADSLRDLFFNLENGVTIACGHCANGDDRDPDESVYFELGIKPVHGILNNDGKNIKVSADKNGIILLALSFQALKVDRDELMKSIDSAPDDITEAININKQFMEYCLRDYCVNITDRNVTSMVAKAIHGLLFNLAKGEGRLNKHLSAYPSRGTYPTHFLWDTCFENLAYELINTDIAMDLLLQFAETQRTDGKYEQFICSTWGRPHDTQPALVGWATLRLYKITKNKAFLERMLESIELNNKWWLTARMTGYGLVYCPGGLETGQDDSPRFDNGPTIAVDMNSYLLNQIGCCIEMRRELGLDISYWQNQFNKLSHNISEILYDSETALYYDLCLKTNSRVKIVSPSSFLPVWAGVKTHKPEEMIKRYLINPTYLFGDVPFPSVAYTEDVYDSSGWWRGPTWLPVAWLMLETLNSYGFDYERNTALKRLYDIIIKDGKMSELFDSKTGEGLGATEQGWTCAIFLRLLTENTENLTE